MQSEPKPTLKQKNICKTVLHKGREKVPKTIIHRESRINNFDLFRFKSTKSSKVCGCVLPVQSILCRNSQKKKHGIVKTLVNMRIRTLPTIDHQQPIKGNTKSANPNCAFRSISFQIMIRKRRMVLFQNKLIMNRTKMIKELK